VVVAFISSQITAATTDTDLLLEPSHKDFAATGLRVPSVLRLHRLVTLTSGMIRRELGGLSHDLQREVDRKLVMLFGLGAV
jgi:mRNA interferase MazF